MCLEYNLKPDNVEDCDKHIPSSKPAQVHHLNNSRHKQLPFVHINARDASQQAHHEAQDAPEVPVPLIKAGRYEQIRAGQKTFPSVSIEERQRVRPEDILSHFQIRGQERTV